MPSALALPSRRLPLNKLKHRFGFVPLERYRSFLSAFCARSRSLFALSSGLCLDRWVLAALALGGLAAVCDGQYLDSRRRSR
jgi:hypothetical protein